MTFCPATFCPLFAKDGSPWTGEKNGTCPQDHDECGWWQGMGGSACDGCTAANQQIDQANLGKPVLQLGPVRAQRGRTKPTTYDCPHAFECQWQRQASPDLCPPRRALAAGLDPRLCAY